MDKDLFEGLIKGVREAGKTKRAEAAKEKSSNAKKGKRTETKNEKPKK